MGHPQPAEPINRSPHRRVLITTREIQPDRHQTRTTYGHTLHRLVADTAEDHLIMSHPQPTEPINRSPHRRIPVAAGGIQPDRHQAGTSDGHALHLLIAFAAEDHLAVGDPVPDGRGFGRGLGPAGRRQHKQQNREQSRRHKPSSQIAHPLLSSRSW